MKHVKLEKQTFGQYNSLTYIRYISEGCESNIHYNKD